MIIDCLSGSMNFGKFVIVPHMSYNELIENISKEEILMCENNNMINILLKPFECGDYVFLLRLFFDKENQELKLVQIAIIERGEELTWEKWDYKKEIRRKKSNEKWLLSEINKINCQCEWGNIKSVYNSLEGSSYVVINYI